MADRRASDQIRVLVRHGVLLINHRSSIIGDGGAKPHKEAALEPGPSLARVGDGAQQ
jgi:hypothetical protein